MKLLKEGGFVESAVTKNSASACIFDALPLQTKEFYQSRKDFQKAMDEYDMTNSFLRVINEIVSCYRYELSSTLQKVIFCQQQIMEKILNLSMKLYTDTKAKYESQITENLTVIEKLEREKRITDQENRDIRHRYIVQESLLKITKVNSDSLQNEIVLLHELLKKDVFNMINHLGTIESNNALKQTQQNKDDPSAKLASEITNLEGIIKNIEQEQVTNAGSLHAMSNLIKAMLKGEKQDASTQVDEADLAWSANMVISDLPERIENPEELEQADVAANSERVQKLPQVNQTNRQILTIKEKEIRLSQKKQQGQGGSLNVAQADNWTLPVTLIIFLENTAKFNEQGRVTPWIQFKKLVLDIYRDRIANESELVLGISSAAMTFDSYLCLFFLKTHKLRRIAELKLFEFLISLRYYSKSYPRATQFAYLANILHYPVPVGEHAYIYKYDVYAQMFYFYVLKRLLLEGSQIVENESYTFLPKTAALELSNEILSQFTDQQKQKVNQKIMKQSAKLDQSSAEFFDLDKLMDLLMEEYFESKKRANKMIAKQFQKIFEQENGIYSIEDVKKICREVTTQKSYLEGQSFPSDPTLGKLFLYALTSARNKFDLASKEFMISCSKYGLDCPFPYIRSAARSGDATALGKQEDVSLLQQNNTLNSTNVTDMQLQHAKRDVRALLNDLMAHPDFKRDDLKQLQAHLGEDGNAEEEDAEGAHNKKQAIKVDAASTLFAQHFSIIRELRTHCKNFKESLGREENPEILWNEFGNIMQVLDAGCQFFNLPINV